jgi:AsmA protein
MTGRLGGTVSLIGGGADPDRAIRRARGTARIAVTDGRMPGLEIVRNVVLAFGKPSGERPAGSGESFSRLAATLTIGGGTATTSDLTFASRDFDMTGKGTLSFETFALDFRDDVLLSQELSAQAGRDLYRLAREGDRVVLPARITGTVSEPSVFIDVASAFQRALRNKAEDEMKSLLDRFRKRVIK